ncbi:insulinase family protein [Fulvivirga sp. 29W222]|uniref:Insulinase family protein n=1 Tax=Fulvivirga marina TaxID=2494733 RepID=A0A937FXJ3_9BACT|nr:pitrilysin family protein [Fulvivirga marina]MBL6446363.1 insulinase family protein [Fulvivirga marina]
MKTINFKILLALVFISFSVVAQVDRTKAPEPGPAPKIQIGQYQFFELKNGLKVFVVENHKIPRVAFSLTLDNEPILEKDKAGYVNFMGQLLRNGTTNRSKAKLDEEVDFIGASLSTSSGGVYGASLTKHKEKLLDLMTDVLFNPAFPEEELEKIRKQTLSGLAASKDDPNAIAGNVRSVLVYGKDHPYGEITTEETVKNINVEDAKAYYNKYFKPNVGYLAVVGDIKFKDAKKLVTKYFSKWEKGEIVQPTYKVPEAPEKTIVAMVDRPASVQSVINVTYPLQLEPGNPDVIKSRVLNQILGGGFSSRLMQNLREDKAFTYGARSSLSSDELVGSFNAYASVRNEVTDSAVHEFLYELERIRKEEVLEKELLAAKASVIGSFARALEQPSTVASFAINTSRYNLPEDYYANYLKNVSNTSLADIKAMAEKYIKPDHANVVVVGKASEVAEGLKKFGTVKYYDIYGNEYDPSAAGELPAGLTAEKVINNYVKAIGGIDKLSGVKSLKLNMGADMMGNSIDMKVYKKTPQKLLVEVGMGGNIMSKQVLNGEEAAVAQMGNSVPVNDQIKEELVIGSYPFPELKYDEIGIKVKLTGIEKVDTKNAYAVEVTYPSGAKVTQYYDTESGFKIRQTRVAKTTQGEVPMSTDYSEYKEVDGIYFPHLIVQPMGGGMKMNIKTESIEINPDISDDTFK